MEGELTSTGGYPRLASHMISLTLRQSYTTKQSRYHSITNPRYSLHTTFQKFGTRDGAMGKGNAMSEPPYNSTTVQRYDSTARLHMMSKRVASWHLVKTIHEAVLETCLLSDQFL